MQDRFKFRIPFYDWDNNFIGFSELDIEQGAEPYNYGRCYHKDVEQCIGLKDKNGKLIYEGDILQDSEQKILVKYDVNRHCFMFEYQDTRAYKPICDIDVLSGNFEVIGNIHENADLLENKDE